MDYRAKADPPAPYVENLYERAAERHIELRGGKDSRP